MRAGGFYNVQMMGNAESVNWYNVFKEIKTKYDKAHHSIDEAITLEEQEKPREVRTKSNLFAFVY